MPIATEHVLLNEGFSIPNLTGWFTDGTRITSRLIFSDAFRSGLYPTTFYVVCSQFDHRHPPKNVDTCELIIFRTSAIGKKLVNLRQEDVNSMGQIVARLVILIPS